jgi:hypothetical protein
VGDEEESPDLGLKKQDDFDIAMSRTPKSFEEPTSFALARMQRCMDIEIHGNRTFVDGERTNPI